MKRLLQSCMLLIMHMLVNQNYAQVRTVTGTVISNEDTTNTLLDFLDTDLNHAEEN